MLDLMLGIFEHLDITSNTDVYKRVKSTERILAGSVLKKYRGILLVCTEMAKTYSRYQWNLVESKDVRMAKIWDWSKVIVTYADGEPVSGAE